MAAMSVPQPGRAGKVAPSGEGRDRGSVSTVEKTQSALSGAQLFSSLLREYERQAQSEDDRVQSRARQKGQSSSPVKQASQSRSTSSSALAAGEVASRKKEAATVVPARNVLKTQKTTARQQKRSEDSSSSVDDASQHEKNVRYNAAQNQQDWLLQQMLAFSSLASGQQLPSQASQQDEPSALSQNAQAVQPEEGVAGSNSRDEGEKTNTLAAVGMPASASPDGGVHGALSSKGTFPTQLTPTDDSVHTTETGTAQPFSQQSLPQGTEQNGQNAQQRMDASAPSMAPGDMSQLPTQQAGVQISQVSVTAAGDHTSSQGGAQEAASHTQDTQEMRVDSVAYLNAKESAFYNTPPSQVVSAAEQQGARQVSDRDASKASFMDGPNRSVVGGLGASSVDTQHAGSSAVQITQDDSGSMGQEQQNGQESASASGNESQKSTLNVGGTSASMGPTSFQGLVNGSNTATHIEAHSLPKEDNRAAYQPNEAEMDVDSGHSASLLAQKRLSDPSSRLEMTVKTSDSTSVSVQVTRLPEGVAAVSLQGADDATTKALTKSRHELLEQLNAAGIHATSVKIDVLPADLNGINSDHAQDQLGQNASSGGQHGQGDDRSHKGQNQGHDVSGAVMSSTDEDDAARRGAENIIAHLNTPQAVTGSGLNISV